MVQFVLICDLSSIISWASFTSGMDICAAARTAFYINGNENIAAMSSDVLFWKGACRRISVLPQPKLFLYAVDAIRSMSWDFRQLLTDIAIEFSRNRFARNLYCARGIGLFFVRSSQQHWE